ncbi:HD-GYP domain-containing protein [Streptomyces sp. F63]|uniref:HD-GYP domain-containing protein n=1 Tax=Streptomyces sp. F63 TaxID=2824887 RepID=UPI001B35A444|nr:HD-GYP domain-containing protein [Streptomyces sp. F63]MBQ0983910.1 HD-GYP domain-containing protein [Streptomyces sp. F63]
MRGVPRGARAYLFCATLAAAVSAAPALLPGARTPWAALAALAALYALCGRLTRLPLPGFPRFPGAAPGGTAPGGVGTAPPSAAGSLAPVLLAGAFLLPPAAAALVPVLGALTGPAERRPGWLRRLWHAVRLSLAGCAAAHVHARTAGDAAGKPLGAGDFPEALLPAVAAAGVHCLALTLLDWGILVTAEGLTARDACRGLPRALPSHLLHGLAGLLAAALWHSPYGPVTAVSALLPMCVSGWLLAQCHRQHTVHQATIRALVQAVGIKDHYTRGHSERVGRASVLIARELGMAGGRLDVLRFAGVLHDIGKIGVPTRLLRKDGPLTPEERRLIELHPEYGHEMVRGIAFLEEARAAILHHHERLDGRGYPYGLSGDRIPESARVVAVADAFDAMTSTRSYRRARPVTEAVAELRRCAGSQFDPRMVRALCRALDRHGWHPAAAAPAAAAEARPEHGGSPPPQREAGAGGRADGPGPGERRPSGRGPHGGVAR